MLTLMLTLILNCFALCLMDGSGQGGLQIKAVKFTE